MKRRRAEASADGLALMTSSMTSSDSANGLALMTSSYSADGLKVAVARISRSSGSDQQMKRSERDEATSCWRISKWFRVDDVIDDVIIFSRWFSVDDVIIFSRWFERAVARISSSRKLQWIQSQRKDFQTQCLYTQTQEDKSIIVVEDSGEAIDEPDASNSSIQSTGFSLDELSGCVSLGQMPSFYFHYAVRSLGARLSDKHIG
ncbi:clustered mitochondria protein [Dorcoceras hygrometricum]|uniref:Clustered mitochondria protein n=1 Tax=Dorcoceras hygrometricum TaxID=472368 RepID=A0A2Z7AGJ3_9LAMI|nr:clustered mitochondria protein [Dorcoceras hygrometricum]